MEIIILLFSQLIINLQYNYDIYFYFPGTINGISTEDPQRRLLLPLNYLYVKRTVRESFQFIHTTLSTFQPNLNGSPNNTEAACPSLDLFQVILCTGVPASEAAKVFPATREQRLNLHSNFVLIYTISLISSHSFTVTLSICSCAFDPRFKRKRSDRIHSLN